MQNIKKWKKNHSAYIIIPVEGLVQNNKAD